ncbi:MAG: F0F1 ATP synthase subunit B [Patescibacteria group bacterium]|nr:F0F1 ATP synthase subunit B [Patescibacteria group bacterium]
MNEMLTKLGINWQSFIAQLVNFVVLFLILRYFAWKPITAALEQRRQKIAKGIDNAKRADEQLESIEIERKEAITEARKEANKIIEDAKQKASVLKEEKMRMAKVEIEKQVDEAKEMIIGERDATYSALKNDLANLITKATGKIVKDLDDAAHKKLIDEAVKDLETA